MSTRQTLPLLWLLSDARNDAVLEAALRALPRGSGFVFRHYHLDARERRARFARLAVVARGQGHCTVLSGRCWSEAEEWDADGLYGGPTTAADTRPAGLLWLATAHDAAELAAANRRGADGIFVSPVFPTRSHPGVEVLGAEGFHALARQSIAPVIALGGMNPASAEQLGCPRWGAIDGLVAELPEGLAGGPQSNSE
ncbi:thiamine phosphate synthase [Allopontixanthobacter sp.]|uniref:thiamine phosphate synthase n=1 Tax=Allopontixanthobacter sp. TaxID=2906452 RepID=UPI002ABBEEDB|nr:thiamine phosphate synthase [Allopontixanthobacter sp.]MDZ4308560.1 thiamine phosphate synthase [Allopontixanthobacter sp.]